MILPRSTPKTDVMFACTKPQPLAGVFFVCLPAPTAMPEQKRLHLIHLPFTDAYHETPDCAGFDDLDGQLRQ